MSEFGGPGGPIRHVTTGMAVVDADGEAVGTVDQVHMSDAGAVTGAGQSPENPDNALAWIAEAFGSDSDMSPQAQERLARLGFVRVNSKGPFSGYRYVEAGQIDSVVGETLRLSVTADQLFR